MQGHARSGPATSRHERASPPRVRLVTGRRACLAAEPLWRALYDSNAPSAAFLSWPWIEESIVALPTSAQPCLAVAGDEYGPRFVLPLRLDGVAGFTIASPLTTPLAQYFDGIGTPLPGVLDAIGDALSRETSATVLRLSHVREDAGIAGWLDDMRTTVTPRGGAVAAELAGLPSVDAYLATLSTSIRKRTRQRRRQLGELGKVAFSVVPGHQAEDTTSLLIRMKSDWLGSRGLVSRAFADRRMLATLARVVAAAESGSVVSALTLDDRVIAGEIGFVQASRYVAYLGAYDQAFARHGVGRLQIFETISWCFENGIRTYDMLAPADPYKCELAPGADPVSVHDCDLAFTTAADVYMRVARGSITAARRVHAAMPVGLRRAGHAVIGRPGGAIAGAIGMGSLMLLGSME